MSQRKQFKSEAFNKVFKSLYGPSADSAADRYAQIHDAFIKHYGEGEYRIFSAPGRSEIGGNHTDHNYGRVLTCAVSVDTVAFVRAREDKTVRLRSYGYDKEFIIDLNILQAKEEDKGTTEALIRGVADAMAKEGMPIVGFDAYVHSTVLSGSGLSSSAAFEVLVATILAGLTDRELDPIKRAIMSQYAENVHFGKPSGLLDQMAASVGGLITIDFKDPANPVVKKVPFDLEDTNYRLVVVGTGGDHGDLIDQYAAIPKEMSEVATYFGVEKLREIDAERFYNELPKLKGKVCDRALLRAIHFYGDDARVVRQVEALERGDVQNFLDEVIASGESSYKYLQNIYAYETEQSISLALAISERLLKGKGAWRVHGGGFAGTILAFVPLDTLDAYTDCMNALFGEGAATVLSIRQQGPTEINVKE